MKFTFILIASFLGLSAHADFEAINCTNPALVKGVQLNIRVMVKEFKKGSFEYCGGTKGSSNVSITMKEVSVPGGVDAGIFYIPGVYAGTFGWTKSDKKLNFKFSPLSEEGDEMIPELNVTGSTGDSISGTVTFYSVQGTSRSKYLEVPVKCTSDPGPFHACDIWPR